MQGSYEQFLRSPTRQAYLQMRERLLRTQGVPTSLSGLVAFSTHIRHREFDSALEVADSMTDAWLLSPRFHYLRAITAEAIRDREAVECARFEMSACLDGLLATGRGIRLQPFVVTYVSDVMDVLNAVGWHGVGRWYQPDAATPIDIVECDDGEERFFQHPPWSGPPVSAARLDRMVHPLPTRSRGSISGVQAQPQWHVN